MMSSDLFKVALDQLDEILFENKCEPIELRVCGAGALAIVGILTRSTRDLDVITPDLSALVLKSANEVAIKLSIPKDWINNGPASLVRDLEAGWESRCEEIYHRKVIYIFALGRRDMIATKLYAFCDRDEDDLGDLLAIEPKASEIDSLLDWTLNRDGSSYWPKRVKERFSLLKRKLGYE